MKGRFAAYVRFLLGLPRFLNEPMSFEEARATLARRMAAREESFLRRVKRCVYDNPSSPYIPLLRQAGCEYGDLVAGVRRWGLEGLLKRLKGEGVYVTFEEFKGRELPSRGNVRRSLSDSDFDNPWAWATCLVRTGGTSGLSARTHLDLDFMAARACYDHAMFRMLDIHGLPLALWYPKLPASTGVSNSLRYAKIGQPPERWFYMLVGRDTRPGLESRLATSVLLRASRFSRCPLPRPEPVTLSEVGKILDWIAAKKARHGRCVVQSYVSQAVRITQAAEARGMDLRGVQFIVGSEPLTKAKRREIESTGARVFPRYMATEVGTIGVGCGRPSETGDYHLAMDGVAVIGGEGEDEDGRSDFYFTSLLDTSPKVMINVQLGDGGVVEERACGCLLGEMGFCVHLRRVRSFERITGEGMTLNAKELIRIIEDVLTKRYGGSTLDYQWVETEDERSLTRLQLRIAPRVGRLDEGEVVQTLLDELRRGDGGRRLTAEMWRRAGTISIIREAPQPTSFGKTVSVLRWRSRKQGTA